MRKKSPKATHQYSSDFVFGNTDLSIWQAILAWEHAHEFTGSRSRIWSPSSETRVLFFYDLIEDKANNFIDEIPLSEQFYNEMKLASNGDNLLHVAARHANDEESMQALARFIEHLFTHAPALLIAHNREGLMPLAVAVQSGNEAFVAKIKALICAKNAELETFTPERMHILFSAETTDLYTWAKEKKASNEIMRDLYDMGAVCFANLNEEGFVADFSKFHPNRHAQEAPFSSPELFRKALLGGDQGSSSRSSNGMLPGSAGYWDLLLRGAAQAHVKKSPLKAQKMQMLLGALESALSPPEPSEDYYEAIDQLIFMLRAEQVMATAQEGQSDWRGLNPLRRFFAYCQQLEQDPSTRALGGIALVISDIALYITGMVLLVHYKGIAHDDWKSEQSSLKEATGCDDLFCFYSRDTWACCENPGPNQTEVCESFPRDYKDCEDAAREFIQLHFWVIVYGVLGLGANLIAFAIILRSVMMVAKNTARALGPYVFTSDNKNTVHAALKELLAQIKAHTPLLLQDQDVEVDLLLIDKTPETLTQAEFIRALEAMSLCLARYHGNAQFMPLNQRLPENVFKVKNLSAPLRTLRLSQNIQARVINDDVDLENGEKTPLVPRPVENKNRCTII